MIGLKFALITVRDLSCPEQKKMWQIFSSKSVGGKKKFSWGVGRSRVMRTERWVFCLLEWTPLPPEIAIFLGGRVLVIVQSLMLSGTLHPAALGGCGWADYYEIGGVAGQKLSQEENLFISVVLIWNHISILASPPTKYTNPPAPKEKKTQKKKKKKTSTKKIMWCSKWANRGGYSCQQRFGTILCEKGIKCRKMFSCLCWSLWTKSTWGLSHAGVKAWAPYYQIRNFYKGHWWLNYPC